MLGKATICEVLPDPQWMIVRLDASGREMKTRLSLKLWKAGRTVFPGERAVVVLPRTDLGWGTVIHVAAPGADLHLEGENDPSREDLIRRGLLRPSKG